MTEEEVPEEEVPEEKEVAPEILENLKGQILEILREGVNVENKKDDWIWDIQQREIMEDEKLEQLWEDEKEEFKSDPQNQNKANFNLAYKEIIREIVRYNGKPLEFEDFRDPGLDIPDITLLNPDKLGRFLKEIEAFKNLHSDFLTPADNERLDDIVERIEIWVEQGASIDAIKRAELIPEQLIRGFLNFDIQKDREDIYTYWRKIARRFGPMVKSIEAFKGSARDSNLDQELIDKIQTLPGKGELIPYIGLIPATKQDMQDLPVRLNQWMRFLKQALAEGKNITLEESAGEPRDWEELTGASKLRRGSEEQWWSESGTMRKPRHQLDEKEIDETDEDFEYVDPIFAFLLEKEFKFPIRTFEIKRAQKILNKWLDTVKQRGEMEPLEKVLHKKILQIEIQAHKFTGERRYYLPITPWIEEKYSEKELKGGNWSSLYGKGDFGQSEHKVLSSSNINQITSKFFDILADILFEIKGQEQVSLPASPSQTGPAVKTKPVNLQTARHSEGVEPIARTFDDNNLKDKLTSMLDHLDSYYFKPIIGKTSIFINETPPQFSSDLHGSRSFNLIGIEFSNQAVIQQIKNIHATLEDNVNIVSISKIRDYLKQETSAEKQHHTTKYIEVLEELVKALTSWFEDEQWALEYVSYQLHLYLIGKQSEHTLEKLEIKGKNAKKLFKAYEKRGGRAESIIYYLRSFLKHPRFQKLIKEQEEMGINVTQYNTMTNEIMSLTEPETVNEIPDFAKALLETHDTVRKMNGEDIVYATLSLLDIDAMDYLITKMENKYRIDITATDVLSIVNSNNSFQSLSNNYGLSKDVIYEIKGLCR